LLLVTLPILVILQIGLAISILIQEESPEENLASVDLQLVLMNSSVADIANRKVKLGVMVSVQTRNVLHLVSVLLIQ